MNSGAAREDSLAIHQSGLSEAARGNYIQASALIEEALLLDPGHASRWQNLATVQIAYGDCGAAAATLRRALRASPEEAGLWAGLARVLFDLGQYRDSLDAWEAAVAFGSPPAEASVGIARALAAGRQIEPAIGLLQTLLSDESEGSPGVMASAHTMLGDFYAMTGNSHLVLHHRVEAFNLLPGDPAMMSRLAAASWDSGDLVRSVDLTRRLVEQGSADQGTHDFLLSGLLHHPEETGESLRAAHEDWAAKYCLPYSPFTKWENDADPDRRLRIGYLGADFYDCPSFHFLYPLLENHDRSEFEVFGYDVRGLNDSRSKQIASLCDRWLECYAASDAELCSLVRNDRIDILVDTTGHYAGNRVRVFYMSPAPVQVVYPSYPCTTGIGRLTAIVTDQWACPPGMERQYSEPAYRLPSGYLTYRPPACAPQVAELPAARNGYITFGLFHRPVKLGAAMWDAVGQIVNGSPGSRLLIHNAFPELDRSDSPMRLHYLRELASRGISADRLVFHGSAPLARHLEILTEADIALDAYPYNGQTTTAESLWMGVPVITIAGPHHVARVACSLLSRAGYPEWAAPSIADYVRTALSLAGDPRELAKTRSGLRERIRNSNLVNSRQTTGELESLYRQLWRNWCGTNIGERQ
jgi:predicted O-linked N-acetylglucosamine transferase (SPINDLY family)